MKAPLRLLLVSLLTFAAIPVSPRGAEPGPLASVTGGKIRGITLSGSGAVFEGIPYAQPPIGAFRWREPFPVRPWAGVRDATAFGPPCAQNPYFIRDAKETSREDCLYLNVWTPVWPVKGTHLPVMVWIPGGGNFAGSTGEANPGEPLIRHGVVLVTLNYRLGLFGFFSHPELTRESRHHASGNQGILDQIAALRWVQNNIESFGGDPGNVTIFGESAGSFDVCVLMTSPLSHGLFRRVIGESGAVVLAGRPLTLADAEKRGLSLAATWTPAADTSLKVLRGLAASAILAREPDFLKQAQPNLGLVIDGYVFQERPRDVFAAGQEQHVDLLLGNLAHEWVPGTTPPADLERSVMAAYPPELAKQAVALYTASGTDLMYGTPAEQWAEDISFRCPAIEQLVWHSIAGNRSFEFQFDRIPPNMPKELKNAHHSEVQYVFGLPAGDFTNRDRALSEAIEQYWTDFAKTGDPNGSGGLPGWPQFNSTSKGYMELSEAGPRSQKDLRASFCKLWIESEQSTKTQ